MMRWWWVGGLLGIALASVAWATRGTVRTAQGESFTGNVDRNDDGSVTVTSDQGIQTRIEAADVAVVLPATSADQEFYLRLSRLNPGDVTHRMDLANWASQNNRPDLAEIALAEVLKIQPANRAARLALDGADRQMELDRTAPQRPSAVPATMPATQHPATQTSAGPPTTLPGEMLSDEQVNTLRQKELPAEDVPLRILLRNDVIGRYLAGGGRDARAFRALSLGQQARQILATGDPALLADVRIVNDPPSLRIYRQRINPIVTTACGSIGCHGGNGAGDFHLYGNDFPNAAYTNFYNLQTYRCSVGGVPYLAVDRTLPERSLILQFGLASDQATAPHPHVAGYRPRYRVRSDGGYQQVLSWISDELNPVLPEYGITLGPRAAAVPRPSTRAATAPTSSTSAPSATSQP
jgi:hypothetical protein